MSSALQVSQSPTLYQRYLSRLARSPLQTKMETSAVLCVAEEVTSQALQKGLSKVDPVRVLKYAAYGGFIAGPFGHFLFKAIDKAFASWKPGFKKSLAQIFVSSILAGPARWY